ncbi:MAG: hypothetical protein V4598_10695 [Bdellovibrionota bacterium]
MRYLLLLLISFPALAIETKGPCSRNALQHAMKGRKKALSEFSLKLDAKENPVELHLYEIGFIENKKFYHGEVAVEFIRGRCQKPQIHYITMLE